ncbi:ATP-binding cassette domain-containing protein [Alkalicoccus luteus]|uniref:ATP-binding cassette domain-containing protein n=1 Tax=Alkalicoccus luteus TaxID=1237094 RepID=UPI004033C61A
MMRIIRTENLVKSFGRERVVDGISLDVYQGELFGFLGRNGAGKSTFINLITDIMKPDSGDVYLFEEKFGVDAVKDRIGVLPDYSSFYDQLTGLKHLQFFSRLSGKPASKKRSFEVLAQVGLEEAARWKVGTYSFGMKKKLGVAQALIHDPELLILDEPTSGLDAESVIHMQKLVQELNREGKTIFMTSHNLPEVEKICSRIAIMKEGTIALEGSLKELQQQFQATFMVTIDTGTTLADDDKARISRGLADKKRDGSWEDGLLRVETASEDAIPLLVQQLVQLHVPIYGVSVEQPSLEDIFLHEPEQVSDYLYKT